ncbi:hypothetical protein ACFL96_12185 [Thermoproteota archaeon]
MKKLLYALLIRDVYKRGVCMVNQFKKKPFGDRLKDTGFLLKNSFKVIGKDADIIKPTISIIFLSVIMITIIFGGIFGIVSAEFTGYGILAILFTVIILVPYRFFFRVRQKAMQSWVVYNTITGKNISIQDAKAHVKTEKSKLRLIAFIDLVMAYAKSQKGGRKGIAGIIISIFLSFLSEVWDLLSHYMLPAVVIEQKPLKEIIPQIKALSSNIPATLVGVFGIDFVGHVIGSLFHTLNIIFLAVSVGIGYLLTSTLPDTVVTIANFSFSWVPVVIMMYLIMVVGSVYKNLVEATKVIYFTIFYTSVMRPMSITPDMKDELTHYLLMDKSGGKAAAPVANPKTVQLANYIRTYEQKGYSEQQIRSFLASKNYPTKDINNALAYLKKR